MSSGYPILNLDNLEEHYRCPSVEKIAQMAALGHSPSAFPRGVFRFQDHETRNKADELVEQRWREYEAFVAANRQTNAESK